MLASDLKILQTAVGRALTGKGAHVGADSVFAGLDWKLAGKRPTGAPHSIFELVNHIAYWQDWVVRWLDGGRPAIPRHAAGSWPGSTAPASSEEWERAVRAFRSGREELRRWAREQDLLAKGGRKSRLGMLHTIASHNSYHLGQAVFARQLLGAWPPPSGGLTW